MASFTAERFLVLFMLISLVLAAPLPISSRDQQQERRNGSIDNLQARQYEDDGDSNPTATTTADNKPTDSAPWLWAVTTTTSSTTTQWQQPTASASTSPSSHNNDDDDEEEDYQEEDDSTTTTTTTSSSSKATMAASSKSKKGGSGGGSYSGKATCK